MRPAGALDLRPRHSIRQAEPPAPPLQTCDLFWWRRRFRLRVAIHHVVLLVAALAPVRQRRVERLPLLKTAMKEMVRKIATTFTQIPASQQVVIAVRLYYGSWEDSAGMPAQIIAKADRTSALAGDIKMEEQ